MKRLFLKKTLLTLFLMPPILHASQAVKGLNEDEGKSNKTIKIESAANAAEYIKIERKEITSENGRFSKLNLLKTALEADKDAEEIPLPGTIKWTPFLFIMKAIESGFESAKKIYPDLIAHNLNDIYQTADYLGIPREDQFFTDLAKAYVEQLHVQDTKKQQELVNKVKELVTLNQNAKPFLITIAKQYFYKYPEEENSEDMDQLLGVKANYTFEELVANNMIGKEYLNRFPNLKTNPNEIPNTDFGATALHVAIISKDTKSVKALIKIGAHIDIAQNKLTQECPLGTAIRRVDTKMVALLIKFGAKVNQPDSGTKQSPLQAAASKGYNDIIKLLLAQNAQVNFLDGLNQTALDIAIDNNHKETAKILLHAQSPLPSKKHRMEKLKKWGLTN